MIVQCGIKGVGFTGGGTRKKTAIELVDVDVFDLEEVAVLNWTDATYASVGLKIKGRDMISINRIDINADIPIQISDNPNSGIDIDHTVFRDTYLIASSANPNVLVDSGVNLTNVSFEGYNAWCLGGFGFKWIDTAASMVGQSLSFRNIRWEQSTNAGGYIIDIEHNYNLWQLTIENVYGGLNTKGIKLRKCSYNSLINCQYVGSSTALDLDSTTRPTVLQNCNFIAGSSISSPGLTKIFSSGLSKAAAINGAFEIYDTLAPYSGQYFGGLSTYANNAAALAGGLKAGMVYKTSTGAIMIVY